MDEFDDCNTIDLTDSVSDFLDDISNLNKSAQDTLDTFIPEVPVLENNDNYIVRMVDNPDGDGKIVALMDDEEAYNPDALTDMLTEVGIKNVFFTSDYHISYFSARDKERTNAIVEAINDTVMSNDYMVILGDLSDKQTGNLKDTKKFISKINCKNLYLILGNNDTYSMEDYISMGFKTVDDYAWYEEDNQVYVLTHFPEKVTDGNINVHGHIHGEGNYIGMSPDNHIDAWCGATTFIPKKLEEMLNLMENGYYKGGIVK